MHFRLAVAVWSLLATLGWAAVELHVEESGGLAWIRYQNTGGEVVRSFALDVTVDQGRIIGISDFFVGPCTTAAQGYGLFPAAFRDHVTVGPGTNVNWSSSAYTPLAVVADEPEDTLPGLGTDGVTLEFGGLWNSAEPAAMPGPSGTLCALRISEGATVSVSANASRGGVLAADPDMILAPIFSEAFVQPPEITDIFDVDGLVVITFAGGILEKAGSLSGPWTSTGSTNGVYPDSTSSASEQFYRVRSP